MTPAIHIYQISDLDDNCQGKDAKNIELWVSTTAESNDGESNVDIAKYSGYSAEFVKNVEEDILQSTRDWFQQ